MSAKNGHSCKKSQVNALLYFFTYHSFIFVVYFIQYDLSSTSAVLFQCFVLGKLQGISCP